MFELIGFAALLWAIGYTLAPLVPMIVLVPWLAITGLFLSWLLFD